jgi:hypothetical protein
MELERGEDIDIVQKALLSTDDEQSRLLEQIKRRDRSLTLRSPQAIEALASFYEHLSRNPGLNLAFRYVTNAQIGTERLSPMPERAPGIRAWNQMNAGEIPLEQQALLLSGIRTLLGHAAKPGELSDATWKPFSSFVAGTRDVDLLHFVRKVHWDTHVGTSDSLKAAIQQTLLNRYQASPSAVESIYQRLFFYVFNLLSQPLIKRLAASDLQTQLDLQALGVKEQQLFDRLQPVLAQIDERVSVLEEEFTQQQRSLRQVELGLSSLTQDLDERLAFEYDPALPQLDMPVLPVPCVSREVPVARLVDSLGRKTWVALYGEVGRGKTCLVRLIAETIKHPIWIRLSGMNDTDACRRIDRALIAVSGIRQSVYRQRWLDNVCAGLGRETVLVLHNMPRTTSASPLGQMCIMLARASSGQGVRILSSSPYELPQDIINTLGNDILLSEEAPHFSEEEIRELFEAYGAPKEFLGRKGFNWIAALTRQSPVLLAAAARHLASHDWDLDVRVFDEIVRGVYAQQVNEQTRRWLRETVRDEVDRELLYRLSLKGAAFTEDDLQRVSDVAPAIRLPRERLAGALGLWIRREDANSYATSALLDQLGGADLDFNVRRDVHLTLGEAVLEKRVLAPPDIFEAVHQFQSGQDFDKAGIIFMKALDAIQHDDGIIDDWGVSGLWYSTRLPAEMSLNIRLTVRARQIAVCHRLGKSVDHLVADLDFLLDQAAAENSAAVVGVAVWVGPGWVRDNPFHANRYLLRALRAAPRGVLPDGRRLSFPAGATLESLIWISAYGIKSVEELRDWLSTAEQLTHEERCAALESQIVEQGSLFVATSLWLAELGKPEQDRRWDALLPILEELTDRAKDLGFELLWARSLNIRMRILGQYIDDMDAVEVVATEAMALAPDDPTVRFVIQDGIALQLSYANHLDRALPWLRAAIAEQTRAYAFERLPLLLQAARAVGENDDALALRYASEAVELGKASPEISETDLVRALGEQAIALWLTGDLAGSFSPLRDAVTRLLAIEKRGDEWKMVTVLLAHVLGYLANLAKHGRPPEAARGGYPYEAPSRGSLLIHRPEVVAHYLEAHNSLLPASLVSFAEGIGKNDEAAKWALRAFDRAREAGDTASMSTVGFLAIGYLMVAERFPEALDVARDMGATAAAANAAGVASKAHLTHGFDPYSVLGDQSGEAWQEAERFGSFIGLVPAMFRIATVRLYDDEKARRLADCISAACHELSQSAASPKLWDSAAEIFAETFEGEIDSKRLMRKAQSFNDGREIALHTICYIGASLDCSPHQALEIHLAVMPYIQRHFAIFRSIYRETVIPFVEGFWQKVFEESRVYFQNPRKVESELLEIRNERNGMVVQRLLGTIWRGLPIEINEDTRNWLGQQ